MCVIGDVTLMDSTPAMESKKPNTSSDHRADEKRREPLRFARKDVKDCRTLAQNDDEW